MNLNHPSVSFIIPTLNSEKFINLCLRSITGQDYPKDKFEVIIVDNGSRDNTVKLAKKLGAKVIIHRGKSPQVCQQRNSGADYAKGDYFIILDHDMELPVNFLNNFAKDVNDTNSVIDAWYIPEIVIANNSLLGKVRTLEKRFYDDTVISAARIIKKEIFRKTGGYDNSLSGGPADWDMDIQLQLVNAKFGNVSTNIYHHEENLSFWKHIFKKNIYIQGTNVYKKKWKDKNARIYSQVVKKQFSPLYRYVNVFIEKGKWRKLLLPNIGIFTILYFSKLMVGFIYILRRLVYFIK